MKITDKIVTSKIQPTQTNVVWHNPDTGELRMFGEKGWEVVGGKNGGYPAVIIEDNFNIDAKPNIFYHINHDGDDEIYINFIDEEFYGYPVVNEFIFNIHSPANITFNKEISWNNNEEPDFTQEGMYTISILAGIGCYTFINT